MIQAAFEEYLALPTLPLGIAAFAYDHNNDPIIHMGEIRCRVDLGGGLLCGVWNSF